MYIFLQITITMMFTSFFHDSHQVYGNQIVVQCTRSSACVYALWGFPVTAVFFFVKKFKMLLLFFLLGGLGACTVLTSIGLGFLLFGSHFAFVSRATTECGETSAS